MLDVDGSELSLGDRVQFEEDVLTSSGQRVPRGAIGVVAFVEGEEAVVRGELPGRRRGGRGRGFEALVAGDAVKVVGRTWGLR